GSVVVGLGEADVSAVGALRSVVGAAGTVTCVVVTVAGCVFVTTVRVEAAGGTRPSGSTFVVCVVLFSTIPVWLDVDSVVTSVLTSDAGPLLGIAVALDVVDVLEVDEQANITSDAIRVSAGATILALRVGFIRFFLMKFVLR